MIGSQAAWDVELCPLNRQITVANTETLRIKGLESLDHPEINRGGTGRHFVMTGTSKLTLMNLKLSHAKVVGTDDASKGGALRIESPRSTTLLINVTFASNTAYGGTGNIYSTSFAATVFILYNSASFPYHLQATTIEDDYALMTTLIHPFFSRLIKLTRMT